MRAPTLPIMDVKRGEYDAVGGRTGYTRHQEHCKERTRGADVLITEEILCDGWLMRSECAGRGRFSCPFLDPWTAHFYKRRLCSSCGRLTAMYCSHLTVGGQVGKILPYCISHPRYRHLPRYVLYPSQLISLTNLEFLRVRELWEASSRNIVG